MAFLEVLLMILLLAVVGVLIAGVVTMGHPNPNVRRYNTTLMRYRVILQGAAVALLGLLIFLSTT